jgi:hypothetical protein
MQIDADLGTATFLMLRNHGLLTVVWRNELTSACAKTTFHSDG